MKAITITTGSEKQIAWATDIKAQMLRMMERAVELATEKAETAKSERIAKKNATIAESVREAIANVSRIIDANWFIDNRKLVSETDEDTIAAAEAKGWEVDERGLRTLRDIIIRCSVSIAKLDLEGVEMADEDTDPDHDGTAENAPTALADAIARNIAAQRTTTIDADTWHLFDAALVGNRLSVWEYCAWLLADTRNDDVVEIVIDNAQYAQDIALRVLTRIAPEDPIADELRAEIDAIEDWLDVMDEIAEDGCEPTSAEVCRRLSAI